MDYKKETIEIEARDLGARIMGVFADGYHLVQILCLKKKASDGEELMELNYSFDKDYSFLNLKFEIAPDEEIGSITSVYQGAYLYENELHDLFGIKVKGISVDFKGNLYKLAHATPFKTASGPVKEKK